MCESSISERNCFVRGVEACDSAVGAPTSEEFRIGPRGAILVDSSKLPACEGVVRCSWVERPITTNVLGHEIQEERTKFTVYKIMVTGGQRGRRVIFRRYTDFCRLNDKLKALSPDIDLALPPKRRFKDNYDRDFLQERQTGLQVFLRNLTSHKDLLRSEAVRLFLSLVDHPGVFDSLEEIRAVCETLEETNHRLQRELLENQRVVNELKHKLEQNENHISLLLQKAEHLSLSSESFKSSSQVDKRIQTHSEEETCERNTHR